MKFDLKQYFRMFREGMMQIVRSYPVELALAVYACVMWLVVYESDRSAGYCRLAVVPIFFALALAVNRLAGRGPWRRVYWVIWVPLIPLSIWGGLEDWVGEMQYIVTLCILAPLSLLLCRRALCNGRFVNDAIVWLRSLILAELFANVARGLFVTILLSTAYIFGFEGAEWCDHVRMYAFILTDSLVVVCFFLMMAERWRDTEIRGNRILEVLLNYIVTPALLIYTALLYLYALKIVVTWSLPEGGVAYMVFGFTMVVLVVKALQFILEKRRYDWFFDRFSLISLPLLVLFWVGVVRRTNEYGFTESRVWLVACGGLMTLCVLLFLSRRSGRYWWVCAAGFLLFALLAYVPGLQPERIAVRSQLNRALRLAGELQLLDDTGAMRADAFRKIDLARKIDYRRCYEAIDYVYEHDKTAFSRFGVDMDDLRDAMPKKIQDYVVRGQDGVFETDSAVTQKWEFRMPAGFRVAQVGNYSTVYTEWRCWGEDMGSYDFLNDTLHLYFGGERPDAVIAGDELLETLLQQAGIDPEPLPTEEMIQQAKDKLLVYRTDDMMIVFDGLQFKRDDSTLRISNVWIGVVLTR